ncbi:MAG: GTP cyclohydrolase I FolE [Lachnospiraceae bacterium]|nr:GTP cyclohydrolase I FolE [Lachnospiraceae bacterium]
MVDESKVKEAVALLLEGIGEDPEREGLRDTPERVARMYSEILAGKDDDASVHLGRCFLAETDDMVMEKDIVFYSTCEHHLMPFFGTVHIAYIPDGRVTGLSKLSRTVEVFARRLQMQERMTAQIADAVYNELSCKGVMVVAEAEHTCVSARGIKKSGAKTVTCALRGCFKDDKQLQDRFLAFIGK